MVTYSLEGQLLFTQECKGLQLQLSDRGKVYEMEKS